MSGSNEQDAVKILNQAEQEANLIIKQAKQDKDKKIREAKIEAEVEIQQVKADQEKKYNLAVKQRFSNDQEVEDLKKATVVDIKEIYSQYSKNQQKAVELLMQRTIDCQVEIPKVNKGFEELIRNIMQKKLPNSIKIRIYGKYSSLEYYYTIEELGRLSNHLKSQQQLLSRINLECIPMHETHYDYFLKDLKRTLPQFIKHRKNAPLILINKRDYIANAKDLSKAYINLIKILVSYVITKLKLTDSYLLSNYNMENFENNFEKYLKISQNAQKDSLAQGKKNYVYIDYNIAENDLYFKKKIRLIIQLQSDIAPKTCENFIHLCEGDISGQNGLPLTYKFSKIQRFYKDFFFVSGDNNGTGGNSIFGENFEDETKIIKHDMAGVLGMSHRGPRHSNGSQFYVSMAKIKDFDGKYVAFGQVLYGLKQIRKISKIQQKGDIYLPFEVTVDGCGLYEYDANDFQSDFEKYSNDVFEEITTKAPTIAREYDEIMKSNFMFMYQPQLTDISSSFGKSQRPQTVPTQGENKRSRSKKLPVDITTLEQSTYSGSIHEKQKSAFKLSQLSQEYGFRKNSPNH